MHSILTERFYLPEYLVDLHLVFSMDIFTLYDRRDKKGTGTSRLWQKIFDFHGKIISLWFPTNIPSSGCFQFPAIPLVGAPGKLTGKRT